MAVMLSCSDDDKKTGNYSPMNLLAQSPAAGEQVIYGMVEVVFEFDQPITINDAAKITLNNQAVENAYAVARYLKARVPIEGGSSNIFKIDAGALTVFSTTMVNESVYSTEFTATDEDDSGIPGFDISPTPCNPNADAGAKALYTWMLKQYGKKIISGSTQEEPDFSYAKQNLGKTPLLKGYDMQPYSPRYAWLWENDGHAFGPDLNNPNTPNAIAWYNENDRKPIIAFTWHWHSPMGGAPGTNTFYTAETDFDASQAVIEGTEEYNATIRDIDAIAVQLKKLSDAGVPVLWRPLHEGSGTWFWWGAKGSEVYKKLWNMMYDRLTNHHQLNNLLWVYNGGDVNWYPGDDKCDIITDDVGEDDIYKDRFVNVYSITNGKKMLGLSESGNAIMDPDKALSEGVYWSYWMTWHGAIKNGDLEDLKAVYNNPLVITLESYVE